MDSLWAKADENAAAARLLLQHRFYNVACARAYYAMFTAARALLEEIAGVKLEATKRHATVIQLFSLHFVRTGRFDEQLSKAFRRASAARGVADYDESSVTAKVAEDMITTMGRFLAGAAALRELQRKS